MKNIAKHAKITLTLALFLGWGLFAMAQGPPPPPGGGHGQTGNQAPANGGSAPIGGGIAILLSLGAAWGGKKVYQAYKDRDRLI